MKKSKGSEDNNAVIDEDKQEKDKVANEESPPDTAGDDSDAKDESLTWDVTKAQACVEQLLDLFPDMTLEKARSLLELVCDDPTSTIRKCYRCPRRTRRLRRSSMTPSMQKPKTLVVTRWTISSPS